MLELSDKLGEAGLIEDLVQYAYDPLAFVYAAYPWGKGQLKGFDGPDDWQIEILKETGKRVVANNFNGVDPVDPLLFKTQSGRGIGKTALIAWIANWIMSTRPHCKGTVTANTEKQVKTKTWSEIRKWFGLSFTSHWFDVKAESVTNKKFLEWRMDIQTSNEDNFNSFTGQHAINSTGFFLLDEAPTIPDKIWETMISGLTDGEPMVFAFGNPVLNSGYFYNITRSARRGDWFTTEIDSRDVKITNKRELEKQVNQYGEDSDYTRMWIRGKAPRSDNLQLITEDVVDKAVKLTLKPDQYMHAPIVLGCDPAWQGSDPHVLGKRQGRQALIIGSWVHLPHETVGFTNIIAHSIKDHRSDAEFIDQHGIGGGVYDQLCALGYEPILCNSLNTNFALSERYANARTKMWFDLLEWLKSGGSIPDDEELKADLMAPHVFLPSSGRNAGKYVLESKEDMKKRGIASPGKAEVLAYTFYQPVVRREHTDDELEWDPDMRHGTIKKATTATDYSPLEYR